MGEPPFTALEIRRASYRHTLAEHIQTVADELPVDAVGLWQIVPAGRQGFGLSGADLEEFVCRCVFALLERGAVPVIGGDGAKFDWLHKPQYGEINADIALVDVVTQEYKAFGIESDCVPYGSRFMVVTHLLRHWLPDVFWGTVFGPAYVRLFGKERLLSAPAYLVEDIGPEMVYVQLTEKLADAANHSEALQLAREAFKMHFDNNAFFISGRGYDRLQRGPVGDVFNVPDFKLNEDTPVA